MSNENIHVLKVNETRSVEDRNAAVLGHIVAAHAKLEKLRVFRQEMKAEFQLCKEERDTALRDLEQVRSQLSASEMLLAESEEIITAQSTLIEELRATQERPESRVIEPTHRESSVIITGAIERHEQNLEALDESDVDAAKVDDALDTDAEHAVDGNASLLARALGGVKGLFGLRKA